MSRDITIFPGPDYGGKTLKLFQVQSNLWTVARSYLKNIESYSTCQYIIFCKKKLEHQMELAYIFYKELPIDGNNIYTANLSEKNEVQGLLFKRSNEYAVTGLSITINQDIQFN